MPRPMPDQETLLTRYEARVDRSGGPNACHPWTGGRRPDGYGLLHIGRRKVRAHRWMFEQIHGPLDPEVQVCHSCDNPPCQNPRHWFAGTNLDNQLDKISKGRGSTPPRHRGETHPQARLTDAQVEEIRSSYTGEYGQKAALSRQFNVSQTAIAKILKGDIR